MCRQPRTRASSPVDAVRRATNRIRDRSHWTTARRRRWRASISVRLLASWCTEPISKADPRSPGPGSTTPFIANQLGARLHYLPFENNGQRRGHCEDQQKNRQLLGNGVTGLGDADPHVAASDYEPERDVSDRRRERRAGIVGREQPTQ